MRKSLRYLLLAALTMVCSNALAATTVTWSASSGNALNTAIAMDDNITLTWSESNGDMAPKYSGSSVYFYNGNQVKLTAANEVTISKISFTFSQGSNGLSILTGGGTYSQGVWTGEASEVSFRAARQTGVRYISAIEVTYTKAGEQPEEKKAVLSITNVDNFNTEVALETGNTITVYYTNTGNTATENAKLTLYVDNAVNNTKEIGAVAVSNTEKWAQVAYDVTTIAAGEHSVYVALTADNAEAVQTETKTVTFTKAAPTPAFSITAAAVTVPYDATSYNVVATLTETNNVAATDVKVELRKGISDVLATQTVATLAAGGNTQVTLTVAKENFETGTKTYYLYVNDTYLAPVEVTFEEAPVAEVKDLAITEVLGTIKLENETNNVRVSVQNNGNVDITNAAVVLKAGEKTLGEATVSAKAGETGFCTIAVASEGLEAGELDVIATVTVEGDATPADNTMSVKLTVEAAPVLTPAFSITAAAVTVPYDATSYNVVATLTETNNVAATDVKVELRKGISDVLATQTVATLAAGGNTQVTLNVAKENFETGKKEYYLYVNDTYLAPVEVTFEEAPVTEVKDLAITEVLGTIKLENETNNVRVSVQNNGNVDITNAAVVLKAGEKTLGEATVSAKAGETGFCTIAVASEGLEAGELDVTATVTVEGDATPADNTMSAKLTVEAAPSPEATFTVAAENVTVEFGKTEFNIIATIKNTSEVEGKDVEVKLLKGIDLVQTKLIATFAAGTEKTVTFTINEIGEAGTTAHYYVQAGNAQAEVIVTFKEQEVAPVVNVVISAIQGTLSLDVENNNLTVFVENKGNVDVKDAKVTLTIGTKTYEGTVSAKAGETGFCSFTIPATDLEAGALSVTATVTVEGNTAAAEDTVETKQFNVTTAIQTIKAQFGENVQIFTLSGKKVNDVRRGQVYIVNGKKMLVK